jgi:hypothetical protein
MRGAIRSAAPFFASGSTFARGQNFAYSLEDIGHSYRDYVALMGHFDGVLPGRVQRVFYEATISDTETQGPALLAYWRAAIRGGVHQVYENERVVRTASSEQGAPADSPGRA